MPPRHDSSWRFLGKDKDQPRPKNPKSFIEDAIFIYLCIFDEAHEHVRTWIPAIPSSNYAAPMRWIMVNVDNHRTTMQQLAPEEAAQPINIQYTVTWPWHAIMDWALIPSEDGQTVNHKLKHLLNKQLLLQQNHLLPQISALTERSLQEIV